MKFNNCAAWAKGWYKTRENTSAWWMDLIHCIYFDGWSCLQTKQDVVTWILHRFDEEPEWFRKGYSCFGFTDLITQIQKYKEYASWHNEPIPDDGDCIIMYFRCLLSCKKMSDFDEGGYKPNDFVLPFSLHEANYSDGRWSDDNKPSFEFAEMHCDAVARVNKSFKDLPDQEIKDYASSFEDIEGDIKKKNWKDVVTELGVEQDCDTFIYDKELNHRSNIEYDDKYINMNIYNNSIDFEPNKRYRIYYKTIVSRHFVNTDYEYTDISYLVKKIIEE